MAGLIPREFIDELIQQTDIVELIDSYVPLKKRGQNHMACCPFHSEKTPSFNVSQKKQFYHCFGCGVSGNAISFLINYLQLGFVDAIELLAAKAGIELPQKSNSKHSKNNSSLNQFMSDIATFYKSSLKHSKLAIDYLKNRKLQGKTAHLYHIGYAPSGWNTLKNQFRSRTKPLLETGMIIKKDNGTIYDRFRHRIMFPIHDRFGRIVGFGGRVIDNSQEPKYLNSPETRIFQKNRELYGLYQIIQQKLKTNYILIVEGYMDVLALAQHGINNVVATLGTATSVNHIQLLRKYCDRIIFCFDGDSAGRQAAWRALENTLPYLNTGMEVQFVFLPDSHDPDSLVHQEGKDNFLQRIEKATPLHHFFFNQLTESLDLANMSGKNQLMKAVRPYLTKMQEGPYQQLLYEELSRLTRIESHRIQQLMMPSQQGISELHETTTLARTPLRLAIALLLQNPSVVEKSYSKLQHVSLEGEKQRLLQTLMQQVINNPQVNTASLVELWRGHTLFDTLNTLATWDHQVPENAQTKEFIDVVTFLTKKNQENKIQKLLDKARVEGLTVNERIQLQTLLKQRHKQQNNIE